MSQALLGEPLLSVTEVANHLGVHRATIYRLASRPDGIPCVKVGGSIRFRPRDVRDYEERHHGRLPDEVSELFQ